MSFKSNGIESPKHSVDRNGKRIFDVPEYNQQMLCTNQEIINILDFEDDVDVNGKKGRCWVLFEKKEQPGVQYKFCTSSKLIKLKLNEAKKRNLFPVQDTFVFRVDRGGRYTYDLE